MSDKLERGPLRFALPYHHKFTWPRLPQMTVDQAVNLLDRFMAAFPRLGGWSQDVLNQLGVKKNADQNDRF